MEPNEFKKIHNELDRISDALHEKYSIKKVNKISSKMHFASKSALEKDPTTDIVKIIKYLNYQLVIALNENDLSEYLTYLSKKLDAASM